MLPRLTFHRFPLKSSPFSSPTSRLADPEQTHLSCPAFPFSCDKNIGIHAPSVLIIPNASNGSTPVSTISTKTPVGCQKKKKNVNQLRRWPDRCYSPRGTLIYTACKSLWTSGWSWILVSTYTAGAPHHQPRSSMLKTAGQKTRFKIVAIVHLPKSSKSDRLETKLRKRHCLAIDRSLVSSNL